MAQSLSRRYCIALGAVAFLVILDQLVVQPSLIRLAFDAPVINVAGRQRMLSQKLTKAALAIPLASAPRESFAPQSLAQRYQELQVAAELWSQAHQGLQAGDDSLSLPPNDNPEIAEQFAQLEPHFQAMISAVGRITTELNEHPSPQPTPVVHAAIVSLLEHEAQYLPLMDRVVGMFEQDAKTRVTRLRMTGWSIVTMILLLLGSVGLFVTRPAARLINRQFQELAQQEQQYRQLVEKMSDGLAVYHRTGRLIYVNDRLCEMLGRKREELIDRPIASLATPECRDRLFDLLSSLQVSPHCSTDLSWTVAPSGILETQVSTGLGPTLISENSSPEGTAAASEEILFSVITDISERKRIEEALRHAHDVLEQRVAERTRQLTRANQALEREIIERTSIEEKSRQLRDQLAHSTRLNTVGQLATGLAHELNQPLGSISNYAEGSLYLLEQQELNRSVLQDSLTRIREAAMRSGAIIRRLRRLVQNQPSERISVDLNALVQEVCELFQAELQGNDVLVHLDLGSELPQVMADPIQIQQVLVNLLQNAVQAMKTMPRDQREIDIQTRRIGKTIEITVTDSGEGFPPEKADSLFQAFTTTRPNGLGMGLAISRALVQEHGGRLWGDNVSGRGARLRFTIPVVCREAVQL